MRFMGCQKPNFYVNICSYRCERACVRAYVWVYVTLVNSYVKNYDSIGIEKRLKNHFHGLDHGLFLRDFFLLHLFANDSVVLLVISFASPFVISSYCIVLFLQLFRSPFEFRAVWNSSFSFWIWLRFTIFTKFEIHQPNYTNATFRNYCIFRWLPDLSLSISGWTVRLSFGWGCCCCCTECRCCCCDYCATQAQTVYIFAL